MDRSNYTKIYSGNFLIVRLILEKLEDIGITGIVKDEAESGRLAGFPTAMQDFQEIYVHNDEYDKALTVVNTVKAQTTKENSEE